MATKREGSYRGQKRYKARMRGGVLPVRKGPRLSTTGNPHWCTPRWIVSAVRAFGGGVIDLDPAGNEKSLVAPLTEYDGRAVDGLTMAWTIRRSPGGVAYCNPPYTRGLIDRWAEKLALEGSAAVRDDWNLIALLPQRSSARWYQAHILPTYQALCSLDRRVKFEGAPQAVPWESVLVYWGNWSLRFEHHFRELGFVERRR